MEHLPLPRNPLLAPSIVPYKCKEPYDGLPAMYYPQRHGWEVLYSPFGITYYLNGEEPTDDELTSMIQNWLYFGTIDELFAGLVDGEEFIRKLDSGETIVTSEKLEDCAAKWRAGLEELKQTKHPRGRLVATQASEILCHNWKVALHTKHSRVDPRIWASIAALNETIEDIAYDIYEDLVTTNRWRTPTNPPFGKPIVDEMTLNGWCPFDVRRIDYNSNSVSTLYYLANLQPPRSHLDHSRCTADLCTSMSIGPAYKTKHMHPTPECRCAGFSGTEKVIECLKGVGLPLIQATSSSKSPRDQNDLAFQIIDSTTGQPPQSTLRKLFSRKNGLSSDRSTTKADIKFVAISHVWAEGLGNPHSNSLPSCSLDWVSRLVNALPRDKETDATTTPFWIDTVCVPIRPKEMHAMAMNRLRMPYQEAQYVLVLDSYLYTQKASELSALEIWCRVLCSSWAQRLWTFQEGRLAKSLWFQFADGPVRMEDIFLRVDTGVAANLIVRELTVAYRINNVVRNVAAEHGDKETYASFRPEPDIRDMRESLKGRAASVPSDEALCLFCNMFLDMELVTTLPVSERMPKFWSSVRKVPIGLVFSDTREKLELPGLRWAPKSFMGDLDTPFWYMEQVLEPRRDGFPTPSGLQIQAPGYLISPNMLVWDDSFDTMFTDTVLYLKDEKGEWYFIEMTKPWNQSRTEFPKAGEQLAILLPYLIPDRSHGVTDDPFSFEHSVIALIGVVTGEKGDVSHFTGYRHARLSRFSKGLQDMYNSISQCVELFVEGACRKRDPVKFDMVAGTILPESDSEEVNDDDKERETPDTFEVTDKRRELVQAFARAFVELNPKARKTSTALGRIQKRTEESAWDQYALSARFQLQMRLRNGMKSIDQTRMWCID